MLFFVRNDGYLPILLNIILQVCIVLTSDEDIGNIKVFEWYEVIKFLFIPCSCALGCPGKPVCGGPDQAAWLLRQDQAAAGLSAADSEPEPEPQSEHAQQHATK